MRATPLGAVLTTAATHSHFKLTFTTVRHVQVLHAHQTEASLRRQVAAESGAATRGSASGRVLNPASRSNQRAPGIPHSRSTHTQVCCKPLQPGGGRRAPAFGSSVVCRRQRGGMSVSAAAAGESATLSAPVVGDGESIEPLVQYVVLRRDLWTELGWPLGSIVAQACHASTAALWESRDSRAAQEYCAPGQLENMHKVVLEVKGETQLLNLAEKLAAADVAHKLWIEQPENFPTCLATPPARKSEMSQYFKKLKLCKGL